MISCHPRKEVFFPAPRDGNRKECAMIPIPFTVLWLIALIVFAVGEAITVGLTSVWFAVGALGALIAAGFGAALWLQVVVFLALSGVTPPAWRIIRGGWSCCA